MANLPAMQEMWVQSLSRKDTLDKEMATHSSFLAWEIPWTEEPDQATVHGVAKESDMTQWLLYSEKQNDYRNCLYGSCCCNYLFDCPRSKQPHK